MSAPHWIAGAGFLAALLWIAVEDARRMTVDARVVLAAVLAGLVWRAVAADSGAGPLSPAFWAGPAAGGLLGLAAFAAPVLLARWRGARRPLYSGDAMLLAGFGLVLGPTGLAWTLGLGCSLALAHRACIQHRRRRPLRRGLTPFGPGLAAGAGVVFLLFATGALAAPADPNRPAAPRPLAARELAPVPVPLPDAIARRRLDLKAPGAALAFPDAVARIAAGAGIAARIEERPARTATGAVVLDPPPTLRLGSARTVSAAVTRAATAAGYAWTWHPGRDGGAGELVFYRYWDRDWQIGHPPKPPLADPLEARIEAGTGDTPVRVVPPDKAAPTGEKPPAIDAPPGRRAEKKKTGDDAAPPLSLLGPTTVPPATADNKKTYDDAAPPLPLTGPTTVPPATATKKTEETEETATALPTPAPWEVLPSRHATLRAVLDGWCRRAGWTLVWKPRRRYAVTAEARFGGDFLSAVDGLLADATTRRSLVARAYAANRHLVIDDAGGGPR